MLGHGNPKGKSISGKQPAGRTSTALGSHNPSGDGKAHGHVRAHNVADKPSQKCCSKGSNHMQANSKY